MHTALAEGGREVGVLLLNASHFLNVYSKESLCR